MKIDIESFWTWVKANKLTSLVVVLVIVLILLGTFLYFGDWVSSKWNQSKVEKALEDVKKNEQIAANILTNIHATEKEKIEAKANVNAAIANLEVVRSEANDAQKIANQALENLNAINAIDFNGTSTDAANAARCRAFPDSSECRR